MADQAHLDILQQGIPAWNKWREESLRVMPDLSGANLNGMDLIDANLSESDLSGADLSDTNLLSANLHRVNLSSANIFDAHLGGADLSEGNLHAADLSGANLSDANLNRALLTGANLNRANLFEAQLQGADLSDCVLISGDLVRANLIRANLYKANLYDTYISAANLRETNLSYADLRKANIFDSDLFNADLSGADLREASLKNIRFDKATLQGAQLGWTVFARLDLSGVTGLAEVVHRGPSTIGTDAVQKSSGKIPQVFLRRCGMAAWEIELMKIYDLSLFPDHISRILNNAVLRKRTGERLFVGGIFIAYDCADAPLVEKLYQTLDEAGASVWLDAHRSTENDMTSPDRREVRIRDTVLLVFSRNSVNRQWIEHELEKARLRERQKGRNNLFIIAVDDSWEAKTRSSVLWWQLTKRKVVDFSQWESEQYEVQCQHLIHMLSVDLFQEENT